MLYFLFAALSVLWVLDLVQTLRFSGKKGPGVEKNPVARFLLKRSREDFILFKMVDLALLLMIMAFLHLNHQGLAEGMLLSFIALYIVTITHNRNAEKG